MTSSPQGIAQPHPPPSGETLRPPNSVAHSRMAAVLAMLAVTQILMMLVTAGVGLAVNSPRIYFFHFTLGLLTALLTVLVHCIVLTYFIVTGKLVKTACEKGNLDREYMERSLRMKTRTMIMLSVALLLIVALVASGAFAALEWNRNADELGAQLAVTHFTLMIVACLVNAWVFLLEYQWISRNSALLRHVFDEFGREKDRAALPPNDPPNTPANPGT